MVLTQEWEGESGVMYLNCLFVKKSKLTERFIAWLTAFISCYNFSFISTIAIAALMESVKTAYEVSSVMSNFTE